MEIVDVDEYLNSELRKDYRAQQDGFVQVGVSKWFLPMRYRKQAEKLRTFEVRSDDIWITGYPRSGTTLTEELVWLLSHDLNYGDATKEDLSSRVRFFELDILLNEKTVQEVVEKFPEQERSLRDCRRHLEFLNNEKRRRVIKTHLPFELLPPDVLKKDCKIIYVCRFPKDVCVSYYLLQSQNQFMDFCGGFEKYWTYFRNGTSVFGPYFEHVKQGLERIGSKNFTFVFYEDFKKDTRGYIKKLSNFLEVPLSEVEMENLEKYIDIENFRKVNSVKIMNKNNEEIEFIRRGKVGGWSDYFTEQMSKEADEWIALNTRRIGFKYPQHKSE